MGAEEAVVESASNLALGTDLRASRRGHRPSLLRSLSGLNARNPDAVDVLCNVDVTFSHVTLTSDVPILSENYNLVRKSGVEITEIQRAERGRSEKSKKCRKISLKRLQNTTYFIIRPMEVRLL